MKNELTAQQAAVLSEALSRLEKLLQFADGDMKSATVGLINSQLLNSKPDGKGTFLSDAMNSLKGAAVWKILNDALRPVMSLKTNNSGEQRQKSLNTLRAVVVSLRDESSSALIDQTGRKPDADRTQKKNSTKNLRPWDTNCQRMAKAYIRQCVKGGRKIVRLAFITRELSVNRTNYPNAKSAATINKAFQVNLAEWGPALSKALSKPDADRTH